MKKTKDLRFLLSSNSPTQTSNSSKQAATYRLYEAKPRNSDMVHTIRVLDPTTEFVSANYDLAATLFIQELLRLQSMHPGVVLINSFEMSSNDRLMAYASLPYYPLNLEPDLNQQNLIPKDPNTMVNLIKGVVSDVEFLWRDIQFRDFMKHLGFRKHLLYEGSRSLFLRQLGQILRRRVKTEFRFYYDIFSNIRDKKGANLSNIS